MPAKPKKKITTAQRIANPNWRSSVSDAALKKANPALYAKRVRVRADRADPLAPVSTFGGIRQQAGNLVETQQAPEAADIKAAQDRADAQFRTRSGIYRGLADYQTTGYQNAFNNLNSALNSLITTTNAQSAADKANLATVLKGADQQQIDAYKALGVAPPPAGTLPGSVPQDTTADRLGAVTAGMDASQAQLAAGGQSQLGAATAMQGIPAQDLTLNLQNLTGEQNATNTEIENRRKELTKQRPGLIRQAIRDLQDFEVAKRTYGDQHANMLFQQYLSAKEFDEKVKQESFSEWLQTSQLTGTTAPGGPIAAGTPTLGQQAQDTANRTAGAGITGIDPVTGQETVEAKRDRLSNQVDWFNAHTNRTQAEAAMLNAMNDPNNPNNKGAEEKAKRIAKGVTALAAYLAPQPGEGSPPSSTSRYPVGPKGGQATDSAGKGMTRPATQEEADAYNKSHPGKAQMIAGDPLPVTAHQYVRRFDGALAHLKSQGLTQGDALRVLAMSTFTDWKKKARYMLSRMRSRGTSGPVQRDTSHPAASGRYGPT